MKGYTVIVCIILVLLISAVPVTAASTLSTNSNVPGSITKIIPAVAETGDTVTITITGVNFSINTGAVWLEKSDETNINAVINDWSPDVIRCTIKTKSSTEPGTWNVVVGKDAGYSTTIVKAQGFAVTDAMSITSITPETGKADTDVDFTIAGKGFNEEIIHDVLLTTSDYKENISADDFDVTSSSKITGTFDLDNVDPATYYLCIENDYGAVTCKKSAFAVITSAEGTIEISSSPTGASILIDDITNGTTPRNINILVGTYKVTLKKAGYHDWSKIVNVQEDESVEVDATLYEVGTATPTPTRSSAERTATPTTRRTTPKSTMKIPTTYAEPVTTAAESPVDPALIIGSLGLAFLALRRR